MGYSLFFSLHVMLGPATPPEVITWLEARIAGQDFPPPFAVPEPAAPMMDDAGGF